MDEASSSSAQASAQRARVGHAGVERELALVDVAAERRQAVRRADDRGASGFVGKLVHRRVDGVGERLEEQRDVEVGTLLGDLDEQPLLDLRVGCVRVVVEQQLDRVGAHALDLAGTPALGQSARPLGRGSVVAALLDRHHEAAAGRQ